MARLLLAAAALAACSLLACALLHGPTCEDEKVCNGGEPADSASLLQVQGVKPIAVESPFELTESANSRLGYFGRLICKPRQAGESTSPGHSWPSGVVALLAALAPGTFILVLILAVMFCSRQQKGSPDDDETTAKYSPFAEIDHVNHSSGREVTYLHPMAGAALIAAWNTTSTMINFPFIFGVLGTLGGIGFTLLISGAACLVTLHMVDLTTHFNAGRRKQEQVVDFPGLGKALGGKIWGDVFAFIQMLNQLGFLPYAITLMVSSTQALFPNVVFLQCNMNTCLIMVAFGYAIVQLSRDWKDAEAFSYLVLILLTIMAVILVCFAFGNQLHYGGPTPLMVGTDYQLFPDCTGACVPAAEQYSLLNIIDAIGCILFSFASCFIIVEMMSEMERPETDAKVATIAAFAYSSVLYCVIGIVFAMLWGNQIPVGVQSLLPKGSWQSIYINLVIIFAMVLDLFIGIIVVNRYIIARYRPDFNYEWTAQNAWDWAVVTSTPATIIFLMTLFIPNLVAVIGFIDCFCVPWAQYILPTMFTVLPALRTCLEQSKDTTSNGSSVNSVMTELPQIAFGKKAIFAAVCVFGIGWSGLEFYKFVHGLADLDFGAGYFCNEVASVG